MISIVIPFFKKYDLMRVALGFNAPFFAGREVVLVMDDPAEEQEVLQLVKQYKQINWRVLINRKAHEWRNPAKALNVGIRHATQDYVFVQSPESVMTEDVPMRLLKACCKFDGYCYGNVKFCKLLQGDIWDDPQEQYPYGSIIAPRRILNVIRGYDETFSGWGGDDDNLRVRLTKFGVVRVYHDKAVLYHLEREVRPKKKITKDNLPKVQSPLSIIANDENWGRDFNEIIYDYKNSLDK